MGEREPSERVPALSGRKLYLRPATADDIATAYCWYLQSDPQANSDRALPLVSAAEAAEAFSKTPRTTERDTLMIVRTKDEAPVGSIRFFDMNSHNRSVQIDIVIDPRERKNGYGKEAVETLCRYLFNGRGMNKIVATTAESNIPLVALLESAGFQRDGVLRRQYFSDGEYRDGLLYSLLRFEAQF